MRKIQRVSSIQEIYEVIQTNGSLPVRVMCSDLEEYICKYQSPNFNSLVKELVASCFLNLWQIPTPYIALVEIKKEHIPLFKLEKRQSQHQFDEVCFGSRVMKNTEVCTPAFMNSTNVKNLESLKADFLKIALFDIWMANDDRTPNNPNLLITPDSNQQMRFVAIDHAATFNTGFLERPLYELSFEDSILYSTLFSSMFRNSNKGKQMAEDAIQTFYQSVNDCEKELPFILDCIPRAWLSNPPHFLSRCRSALFSANWLKAVEITFRNFVALV